MNMKADIPDTPEERRALALKLAGELRATIIHHHEPVSITGLSLYKINQEMQELGILLVETNEEIERTEALLADKDTPPQEKQQFQLDLLAQWESRGAIMDQLAGYVVAEADKVDSTAGFYRWATEMAAQHKKEEDRLRRRRKSFENAAQGIKDLIHRILTSRSEKRINGKTSRFRLQTNSQDKLEVTNPDQVPEAMLDISLTMPLTDWLIIKSYLPEAVKPALSSEETSINNARITTAIRNNRIRLGELEERKNQLLTGSAMALGTDEREQQLQKLDTDIARCNSVISYATLTRGSHVRIE